MTWFIQKVQGTTQFSVSLWMFPQQNSNMATDAMPQAIFHLTMLSTYKPWDYSNQSTDVQHLSQLLLIRRESGIKITTSDFSGLKSVYSGTITLGAWVYIYVGIDFSQQLYTAYVFYPATGVSASSTSTVAAGTWNEQIDSRAKFYVGGSANWDSSVSKRGYQGKLYNARFITDFAVTTPDFKTMINEETQKPYYFDVNLPCQKRVYSEFGRNVLVEFGSLGNLDCSSPALDSPTFEVQNGLKFSAGSQVMSLKLYSEFKDMNFISMWIKINTMPATSATIFSIKNSSNQILAKLSLLAGGMLSFQTDGSSTASSGVLTLSSWTLLSCIYSFHEFYNDLIVTLLIRGTIIDQNLRILTQPIDRQFPGSIEIGGDLLEANIMDIFGGQGSYLSTSQLLSNCVLSVGIITPKCVFCGLGYYLYEGACSLSCPAGYYSDMTARMCRLCSLTCLTCSGPGLNQCLTCDSNYPLLFNGYCKNQCPIGSTLSTSGSTSSCVCDSSCHSCSLMATNMQMVQCDACVDTNQFINGYKCVISQLCPFGTFGDSIDKKCKSTCVNAPITMKDNVNRACVSYCVSGTVKSTSGLECLLKCPATYYQTAYAGANVNETDKQCTACDTSIFCNECTSATECLSCLPGYLIHEYNGVCSLTCAVGFYQDGLVCRVCQNSCSNCPNGYFLKSATCVLDCGTAYSSDTSTTPHSCVAKLSPVVSIYNRTQIGDPDHDPLNVGRRKDIFVSASVSFVGVISEYSWYLEGDSSSETYAFFKGTFNDQLNLLIPASNLKANMLYSLRLKVTANTGNYGEDFIYIKTSEEITEGIYSVTPNSGVAGVTEFTVYFNVWSHPTDSLAFDVSYSRNSTLVFRNSTLSMKDDFQYVFVKSTTQGSVKFVFPPFRESKTYALELAVYSANEQKTKNIVVQLSPFVGDVVSMESEVRRFTPSSSILLSEYLTVSYQMRYLYQTIRANDTAVRLFQGDVLRQKQLLTFGSTFCAANVQCRNHGKCSSNFHDDKMYSCSCDTNKAGDYCNWEEKTLSVINLLTYNIQIDLYQRTITSANIPAITQILRNILAIEDGLSKKTFRFISVFLTKLKSLDFSRIEIYQNFFEIIQNLLFQVSSRPSLRPDERVKFTIKLRSIMDTYIAKFTTDFISLNQEYLYHFMYSNVYLSKQSGRELLNNKVNYDRNLIIPLERTIIQIPFDRMDYSEVVTIQALEYHFDQVFPHPNSTSSHIQLSLVNAAARSLNNRKVVYHFEKRAGFAPFSQFSSSINSQMLCSSLSTIDFTTTTWEKRSTCSFTFENEYYIRCECSAVVNNAISERGTIEYYQDFVPSTQSLNQFSARSVANRLAFYNTGELDFDKNIPYTKREFSQPQIPVTFVPFQWDQPALILAVILIIAFVILTYLHKLYIKRSPVTEYNSASISNESLLLTYHPFVAIMMRGHTEKSHTYLMRLAKFFSNLITLLAMNAAAFAQLQISIKKIAINSRVLGASFASLAMCMCWNYFLEIIYALVKRHFFKEKRNENYYVWMYFVNMLICSAFGTYVNGLTDLRVYGSFIVSYIAALLFDFFVFDILVVSYAFYEIDSAVLKLLSFRGFYIIPNDTANMELYDITDFKRKKYLVKDEPASQPLKVESLKPSNGGAEEEPVLQPIIQQNNQQERPLSSYSKSSKNSHASRRIYPVDGKPS